MLGKLGNMTGLDWGIMIFAVIALRLVSLSTRHYMRGVADFLAANRCAGRYLLTIAGQMGGTGAISIVAAFQMYYSSGLPPIYWGFMALLSGAIVTITGWVQYRYRETRVLTLAQFFELRYGHKFRVFSGFVIFVSGVFNFGIFPAVTSRFFIYYCGIPDHFHMLGTLIPTMIPVMLVDMGLALTFVAMGGQISVIVTECVQGMVSGFAFIIITIAVLLKVHWASMVKAMSTYAPANASMLHPFHSSGSDFNFLYFVVGIIGAFYGVCAWQGTQAFMTSGRSPHEQKMGGIIAMWRDLPKTAMCIVLPLGAYAVMHLPEFHALAATINSGLNAIPNAEIKSEMTTPLVLASMLPIGIKGLFCTVMLFFSFTCYDSYLHSWGSIFIQDVLIPFKGITLSPDQHVAWLRRSIIGVALFGFIFSIVYPPTMNIYFFFAITGTIWLGGAGAVIIGGLYSRKGTTAGAYCAVILGIIVGCGGVIISNIDHNFPLNGQSQYGLTMLAASLVYIIVSQLAVRDWPKKLAASIAITLGLSALAVSQAALFKHFFLFAKLDEQVPVVKGTLISVIVLSLFTLVVALVSRTGQKEFDLDKMLHRGAYSDKSSEELARQSHVPVWQKLLGITGEFTLGDKFLAGGLLLWNLGWFTCFVIFSILNVTMPGRFDTNWWAGFWHFYMMLAIGLSIPAIIWFTVGGIIDLRGLFHILGTADRDSSDDGTVTAEGEALPQVATTENAK